MDIAFPRILKEDWATATLTDGTVIRNRPVLFLGFMESGKKGIGARTGIETVVWSPIKGPPDPTPRTVKDLEKIAGPAIEPAKREAGTCAYEFPKGELLLIRHQINQVRPTGVFNGEGEPQYVVNYNTETSVLDYVEEGGPTAPKKP